MLRSIIHALFFLLTALAVVQRQDVMHFHDGANEACIISVFLCVAVTIIALESSWDFTAFPAAISMICLFLSALLFQILAILTDNPVVLLFQCILYAFLWGVLLANDVQRYMGGREREMTDGPFGRSKTFWFTFHVFLDTIFIFLHVLEAYQTAWCIYHDISCIYDWSPIKETLAFGSDVRE